MKLATFPYSSNSPIGPVAESDATAAAVHDDNEKDTLTGSSGQDCFFANLVLESTDDADKKDKITDLHATEFAADLDFILGEP